jgi:prophage tail gpP-like protein
MRRRVHNVAIRIGNARIDTWSDYEIECDLLRPADAFRVTLPGARRAVWDLCAPDELVQILIDDTIVMTGFIDDRRRAVDRSGSFLAVTGRDKSGRLVDESMPLGEIRGLALLELAKRCTGPWFPRIVESNADNRRSMRGTGARHARAAAEPHVDLSYRSEKRVLPGESRWSVLASALEEAGAIAWSTADGRALVVGLPNHDQEPQVRFFLPRRGSRRAAEGNVLSLTLEDSVAERYSQITVVGSGRGSDEDFGEPVLRRAGVAKDGPRPDGTGRAFLAPKHLLVADHDLRSVRLATVRAAREMAERDSTGRRLHIVARGHAQEGALYVPDTIAAIEDEEIGLAGHFLITAVTFRHARLGGETTALSMVPKGTVLRL